MKYFALLALLVAACGTDRAAFRPTDNVTAKGPGGQLAAAYDVRSSPDRDPHVQVNVWSRGAYEEDDRAIVRMSMEVRNTGDELVTLDAETLRLDAFRNSGALLPTAQLLQIMAPAGALTVPPGEVATIQLVFAIPVDIAPNSIGSLRLRWGLLHDDGRRYVQFTDFRREPEPQYVAAGISYYHPIYGFYDPFLYGPPYGYHLRYHVPVRRVFVESRDRGVQTVRRTR
ncbi:MAG TPA: hypothetical protein VK932_18065 [Kofleriaceae bacterium]|nr:hypothetical protein [Kofleriaceae bacterium]